MCAAYGGSQARRWIGAATLAYTTATAMQDLSHIYDLCHSSWQCQTLNPVAKDPHRYESGLLLLSLQWELPDIPLVLKRWCLPEKQKKQNKTKKTRTEQYSRTSKKKEDDSRPNSRAREHLIETGDTRLWRGPPTRSSNLWPRDIAKSEWLISVRFEKVNILSFSSLLLIASWCLELSKPNMKCQSQKLVQCMGGDWSGGVVAMLNMKPEGKRDHEAVGVI